MNLRAVTIDNSKAKAEPIVFLHGFGGLADQWRGLQTMASFWAPTLAFDLPGHGDSLGYPDAGPPKVAAKAVLAELAARRIEKAHFVGHSMGGAISSLIGLIAPQQVASLTLLAPGGYGTEFNHPLLLRWAAARTREELTAVMPNFFGADYEIEPKVIDFQLAARSRPGAVDSLVAIAKSMSSDGKQGMLPVDDILSKGLPISVVWGEDDQVLPVSQAKALEGRVDLHIVPHIGHSPPEEAPELVKKVISEQVKKSSI